MSFKHESKKNDTELSKHLWQLKDQKKDFPTPEEYVCMFFKWAAPQENPNSLAVLPFINGVTQPLTQILQRHDIQVVNKPLKTLQQ